jgi:hypothetical protein
VPVNAVRVSWSSASFLTYLGGFTILGAVGSLLETQAGDSSSGGLVGWALLIFLAVTVLALLARTSGHRVTAGLLGLSWVAASVVLVGALLDWFGWLDTSVDSPFEGFRFSFLVLELSLVLASALALLVFRFPLLVFFLAAGSWFFLTDLLSSGGDWSVTLTMLIGVVLLAIALMVDQGETRPYAFWLHVVAGLTIGGGLLWFFHGGDWDWVLIAAAGLLYAALGDRLARSSWVVLGAWGILQTAGHFAEKWSPETVGFFAFYLFPFTLLDAFSGVSFGQPDTHRWAGPLVFALTGALFIGIGLLIARRRRDAIAGAELL